MTPHPLRCETCSYFEEHSCKKIGDRLANVEIVHIERVGCASHSSASEQHIAAIRKEGRERVLDTRTDVIAFANAMEKTLRKNDHKDGWSDLKFSYLLDRLEEECKELEECFWMPDSRSEMVWLSDDLQPRRKFKLDRIMDECTDVANFAMMIYSRLAALRRAGGEQG